MLPFERRVVACLTRTSDPERRTAIAAYVSDSLAAMPEHLRAGVATSSVGLGTWVRLRGGTRDDARLRNHLAAWEAHPVDVVRQYVRLMHSLVLFAEIELGDGANVPNPAVATGAS